MVDPVIAADGHTYDKHAIQEWLKEKDESPVTGATLLHVRLVPNTLIKNAHCKPADSVTSWRLELGLGDSRSL